jgi:hypothetical protein
MYTPDDYFYETSMMLLATFSEEELAERELLAQTAAGAVVAPLAEWLAAACKRALAGLAAAFVYVPAEGEVVETNWRYLTLF